MQTGINQVRKGLSISRAALPPDLCPAIEHVTGGTLRLRLKLVVWSLAQSSPQLLGGRRR